MKLRMKSRGSEARILSDRGKNEQGLAIGFKYARTGFYLIAKKRPLRILERKKTARRSTKEESTRGEKDSKSLNAQPFWGASTDTKEKNPAVRGGRGTFSMNLGWVATMRRSHFSEEGGPNHRRSGKKKGAAVLTAAPLRGDVA